MAESYEVKCHRPDGTDPDQRIDGLGGPSGGGWYREIDTLIHGIETGAYRLWTTTPENKFAWVVVAARSNGRKYLKTEADGVEPNNLLKLPRCP
ncbi:DUF3892 domain-containing protein [Mongoliimonas terrestris]|uniref:DUF3892 domain-containing protein n=1 Tax=Mongoliimonas terrestris TaxID=1709001 RepID=UPI000949A08B|nr:DUF3892 domain-containing protein [Mongoliimonas terrestris]